MGRVDRTCGAYVGVGRRTVHEGRNLLPRGKCGLGLSGSGETKEDDQVGKSAGGPNLIVRVFVVGGQPSSWPPLSS